MSSKTIGVGDLKPREQFLQGITDPFQEHEVGPMVLGVYGVTPGTNRVTGLDYEFSFVRAQMFSISIEERAQYVVNSVDDGKLYALGESVHMYNISAVLTDSDLTEEQKIGVFINDGTDVSGNTYAEWKDLYETIRVSRLISNHKIIGFKWRGVYYWGHILGYTASMGSTSPSMIVLGLIFLSMWEDNEHKPTDLKVDGQDAYEADLTKEGYQILADEATNRADDSAEEEALKSDMGKTLKERRKA